MLVAMNTKASETQLKITGKRQANWKAHVPLHNCRPAGYEGPRSCAQRECASARFLLVARRRQRKSNGRDCNPHMGGVPVAAGDGDIPHRRWWLAAISGAVVANDDRRWLCGAQGRAVLCALQEPGGLRIDEDRHGKTNSAKPPQPISGDTSRLPQHTKTRQARGIAILIATLP